MSRSDSLQNIGKPAGPDVFYTDDFRSMIEANLEYIRASGDVQAITVEPAERAKYESDFYSLLNEKGIDHHMHWVVMRMNGMMHPGEYTIEMAQFIIPDRGVIDTLRSRHMTIHTIR